VGGRVITKTVIARSSTRAASGMSKVDWTGFMNLFPLLGKSASQAARVVVCAFRFSFLPEEGCALLDCGLLKVQGTVVGIDDRAGSGPAKVALAATLRFYSYAGSSFALSVEAGQGAYLRRSLNRPPTGGGLASSLTCLSVASVEPHAKHFSWSPFLNATLCLRMLKKLEDF